MTKRSNPNSDKKNKTKETRPTITFNLIDAAGNDVDGEVYDKAQLHRKVRDLAPTMVLVGVEVLDVGAMYRENGKWQIARLDGQQESISDLQSALGYLLG